MIENNSIVPADHRLRSLDDQVRELRAALTSVSLRLVELEARFQIASSTTPEPDPGTLEDFDVGSTHLFRVIANRKAGIVYGTDIYTSDSVLATAVVHAGVLAHAESGLVKVTVLPGLNRYPASRQNGVNSFAWDQGFRTSYRIERGM